MCEYDSIEELMELSIEQIEEHVNKCKECNSKYSDLLKTIYPNINIKIKKQKRVFTPIKRLSLSIAIIIIIVIATISINNKKSLDYSYLLDDNDIMQAVDNMNENDFIDLFYTLKEDL